MEKINRIKKTTHKSTKSIWCGGCDAEKVRVGDKCPNCGFREETKHQKV